MTAGTKHEVDNTELIRQGEKERVESSLRVWRDE